MTRSGLIGEIFRKETYLCVGLDTDWDKIPSHLRGEEDPVFCFNKQIVDATQEYCVAYKLNSAFYEAQGPSGWLSLQKTAAYISQTQRHLTIADAKRGDIGNTSTLYARAFFDAMRFDAITVSPYMGYDSVSPFFRSDKWVVLLAHTSNGGSADFQTLVLRDSDQKLYEHVIEVTRRWASEDQMMYVVGATHPKVLHDVRRVIPHHFLLVPGVGAQGGSLHDVSAAAMNADCGLLVNASRSIIYRSSGQDFADQAREEARLLQEEMRRYLDRYA